MKYKFTSLIFFFWVTLTSAQKPNVLFIMSDQFRYDAMGHAQADLGVPAVSRVSTPNLDQLSSRGAWFKTAYTPCAVCGPARTSILTGRTIENTGVRSNWLATDNNLPGNDAEDKIPLLETYDEILVKENNYIAEFYGKWHSPEQLGFVYDNDVRVAGGAEAWFGKYESDGTTRHMSDGLSRDFKNWLDDNNIGFKNNPAQGEQINTWTDRRYKTDPLDSRHGMAPGTSTGNSPQPNLHGMSLVPDGFSVTAHEGIETLESMERMHNTGNPWSLTVSFHLPHAPMVPTKKYYDMYDPDNMIPPANIDDMDNSAYADANGRAGLSALYHDPMAVQRWMANYYGMVTEIDEWVGLFMDKLEELGITDNTLIIFTADHGEMLGGHGLREKNIFYEESAHVPLLVSLPGTIPAGVVVEEPVTSLDLHSTILDYTGAGVIPTDGSSLRRYIEGTDTGDDFVVTEWNFTDNNAVRPPGSQPAFMIRKGDYKLIVPNLAGSNIIDMAYNLGDDPYEMENLLGSNASTASEADIGKMEHLKALLVDHLEAQGDPAASEVANRQTWPSLDFWMGDTRIDFGEVVPGSSKSDWLYMGTSTGGSLNISNAVLSGAGASAFTLEWTQKTIASGSHESLRITYTGPGTGGTVSDATLTVTGGGVDKTVALTGATSIGAGFPTLITRAPIKVHYTPGLLKIDASAGENWSVQIFDLKGKSLESMTGRGATQIPLKLKAGMYIVKSQSASSNRVKQFAVVNH